MKNNTTYTCFRRYTGLTVLLLSGLFFQPAYAQRVIRGSVTVKGAPVAGVSVMVKGSQKKTITNENGRYAINAMRNDVLVFRYIGYKVRQIPVGEQAVINVALEENVRSLQDLVVVGYGTVAKSDLTGAISSVKLQQVNENRVISVPEALQGKIAGVQILNNTGAPGSGMTFNIRGETSITGSSQPLIVIDGQPIETSAGATMAGSNYDGGYDQPPVDPLASLDPSDIASIEVLKDASATAIYGSRGANGVVLITTKSGQNGKNGKDRISYTTRFDISMLPKKQKVLSPLDFMKFQNEAALNDGNDSAWTQHQIDSISVLPGTNWQDLIYHTAVSQDHQLTLSGRDAKSNYYVTGSFSDQNSVINHAYYKKGGLRVNYERHVSDRLKFTTRNYFSLAGLSHGQQSNWTGILGSSVVMGALAVSPLKNAYEPGGDPDETLVNNPVLVMTRVKDRSKVRTLISSATLDYRIAKGLSYQLKGGVNDLYTSRQVYYPTGTFVGNQAPNGSATQADNHNYNYMVDNLLTYKRVFQKTHSLNAVLGFSYQHWYHEGSSVTNRSFPSDALTYYDLATATFPGATHNYYQERALESIIGRVNYAYKSKYLLTLTGRYDGDSRLAVGQKWGFFPSVGIGWNVSGEDFFKDNISFISLLKLRGSYGVAGNSSIGVGATQAKYGVDYVVMGENIVPGYVTGSFENPDLTWEKTSQYNAGIDLGFINDRLTLTVDAYSKKTTGLLINLSLPGSAGYGSYATNVGEVNNKGVDVEANFNVLSGKVRWDIGANFSAFKNEVDNMGPLSVIYGRNYIPAGQILFAQPLNVAMPGYPISAFLGYKTAGIYQTQEEVDKGPEASTAKPGDIKWVDTNGDGSITDEDRTLIGHPQPDFTYGFNTNLSYKRFTLSLSILGSQGNELLNLNKWLLSVNDTHGNYNALQDAYDHAWRGPGTSDLYPKLNTRSTRLHQRMPDWMVEDASFVRLQSVTIGYTLHALQHLGVESLRLFASGTNLYTLTDYSGYDPNINAFGNASISRGLDFGTLPQPRTFSFGLELTF
ncbi:TonB-dependent receptor [Compostibacter hankyongensis]|uniref:TonB-dependent receptor n=1 Tax=Compostibacter hankyongensis TaxID=1007089 RepID=A0ABP8FMS6_9BACT